MNATNYFSDRRTVKTVNRMYMESPSCQAAQLNEYWPMARHDRFDDIKSIKLCYQFFLLEEGIVTESFPFACVLLLGIFAPWNNSCDRSGLANINYSVTIT